MFSTFKLNKKFSFGDCRALLSLFLILSLLIIYKTASNFVLLFEVQLQT